MSWFGKKKQKQKQFLGFPGDCSAQQSQVLQKFKAHVQQNNKITLQRFDETYLLRFLRAHIKMWGDFIDWRIKNDIDNYKNFKFPQIIQLRKIYPHGYHKVDKQFRPIYIERVGFMDVDKIFKVMETDNVLQYYAVLYQTLLTTNFDGCTKEKQITTGQQNRVTQTVTILDLKHVKLSNASKAYDFVKPVSAMAQNNYPEILGNMFIINAPILFTGIWAIVKMWIDEKTKDKIKILGSSYKKQLLELIDPQNLPVFLDGGKCKCHETQCRLEANVGPWNPEGNQLLENNINLENEQHPSNYKGSHKQQVSMSPPEVLVQVMVKDQIPHVVTASMPNGSQEDKVLKKASSIDIYQKLPQTSKIQKQAQNHEQDQVEFKEKLGNIISQAASHAQQKKQAEQNEQKANQNVQQQQQATSATAQLTQKLCQKSVQIQRLPQWPKQIQNNKNLLQKNSNIMCSNQKKKIITE